MNTVWPIFDPPSQKNRLLRLTNFSLFEDTALIIYLWTQRLNTFYCVFLSLKFNALKIFWKLWFDALHWSWYHITKDYVSCENENFHQPSFKGCSLISMIRSRELKEWYPLILACIPNKFVVFISSDHVITSRDM